MCARHPNIEQQTGRLGRHAAQMVKDGKDIDRLFEWAPPFRADKSIDFSHSNRSSIDDGYRQGDGKELQRLVSR